MAPAATSTTAVIHGFVATSTYLNNIAALRFARLPSTGCRAASDNRIRSRNASTYQKKTLGKRVPREERSNIDAEAIAVEDVKGRGRGGEVSVGIVGHSNVSEQVTSLSEEGEEDSLGVDETGNGVIESAIASNPGSAILVGDSTEVLAGSEMDKPVDAKIHESGAVKEEKPLGSEIRAEKGSTLQSLTPVIPNAKGTRSIGITKDLVQKVKDAEKNILLLNQSRLQALEDLEVARSYNESLLDEVKALMERVAEANDKLELAYQEQAKMKILEKDVEVLKEKLNRESKAKESLIHLETQHRSLQEHVQMLEEKHSKSEQTEAELDRFKEEKKLLEEEISSLRTALEDMKTKDEEITSLKASLFDLSAKEKLFKEMEQEKADLQSYSLELESMLTKFESKPSELESMNSENIMLNQKIQQLEEDAKAYSGKMIASDSQERQKPLQSKIEQLVATMSKMESENSLLKQVHEENEGLRAQVKFLEQRMVETDAQIRHQLDVYQTDVETLQDSLEQLRIQNEAGSGDTLPWEFWSHLLLSIDGWMLEKQLIAEDASKLRDMAWRRDPSMKDVYLAEQGSSESHLLSALLNLLEGNKRPGLHIVHIAAEMAPVAKVGGLGDVVSGLGKALQKNGHLVEVVLPKYDCMDYKHITKLKALDWELESFFDGQLFKSKVWSGIVEGLPVYFIEPQHPGRLFWRGQIYGQADDFRRFTFFSRAALEFILKSGKRPDVIHCHDWHTAVVAPLYWDVFVPRGLDSARVAFTCHNFEYQGSESAAALSSCGLDANQLNRPDRMQDNSSNRINLVKGGVVYSNIVTTVSPTYAQEVKGPEGGKGLDSTMVAHAKKFYGILNGIDVDAWNPSTDPFLDFQYNADDLTGKAGNKAALRSHLMLAKDFKKPLVGCVTRLVPQKGVHLIRHAIYRTIEQGGQFVLLGSSPVPHIQKEFEAIAKQFNDHPHCRLILKYDELLSHSIYAASDIFIIPSIFEPCGLTQMIAMRYGAIPVARKTGGLNDSVFDVDDEMIPLQQRNGFTFTAADEGGLNTGLDRALKYYKERPNWWSGLVQKAMQLDFSWEASAEQYEELFEAALARARSRA